MEVAALIFGAWAAISILVLLVGKAFIWWANKNEREGVQ